MQKYDIVGDVHGCDDELDELLQLLGYRDDLHPDGRKLIFVGDLGDRGPKIDQVFQRVLRMHSLDSALAVIGNHDDKLLRWLKGNPVKIAHGLRNTIDAIERQGEEFKQQVLELLVSLPYKFEDGPLLVIHGAAKAGVGAKEERQLALYGEVLGRTEDDMPLRGEAWAQDYSGPHSVVVRGHDPVENVTCTISKGGARIYNLDTGCVFGGFLSALRYPELETVQVKARDTYWQKHETAGEKP